MNLQLGHNSYWLKIKSLIMCHELLLWESYYSSGAAFWKKRVLNISLSIYRPLYLYFLQAPLRDCSYFDSVQNQLNKSWMVLQ